MGDDQELLNMELYGYDPNLQWEYETHSWKCPYNEGVSCETRRCTDCGWNPAIARRRSVRIRKRLGVCTDTAPELPKGGETDA